mmetsp:Transcript_97901/g.272468  ORF Transcript_97901/g.272468 Transcript_97901/m.272468 type:complete len:253 (-) Transcript_97901:268-1026(-)
MGNCSACADCSTCGTCNCDWQPPESLLPGDSSWQKVQLAVSPIGIQVSRTLQAYHSSVAVNDVEFSFTKHGVIGTPLFHSHFTSKGPVQVMDMGLTDASASQMLAVLEPYFVAGTYDILRKNCNSFSDCALYYLLGARLDDKYKAIDQLGTSADKLGLVRLLTLWDYMPNPRASSFTLDHVLADVGRHRLFERTETFVIGQRVQVKSEDGHWRGANLTDLHSDGRATVQFDGSKSPVDVPAHCIGRSTEARC